MSMTIPTKQARMTPPNQLFANDDTHCRREAAINVSPIQDDIEEDLEPVDDSVIKSLANGKFKFGI